MTISLEDLVTMATEIRESLVDLRSQMLQLKTERDLAQRLCCEVACPMGTAEDYRPDGGVVHVRRWYADLHFGIGAGLRLFPRNR